MHRMMTGRIRSDRMHVRFLSGLLLLLAAGCGNVGDGTSEAVRDGAGPMVVRNTGGPTWSPGTAWRLREDLRLGSAGTEGEAGPDEFGHIAAVVSDSRGRIYVLESMAQEIRVFDSTGVFLQTIGRRGRGPGEFSMAWALSIGPGDTLTVLDDGAMRYSIFAPDGTFIQSHRRTIVGYGSPRRGLLRDGSYIDWLQASPDGRLGRRMFFYPVRYSPGFERVDTFPPFEYTRDMVSNGRTLLFDFGGFVVAAVGAEGGIWFADSREYRVYRRELAGDTTLVFSLPATAVPLGEPERAYVRNRWAHRPEIRAEQLEALPDVMPIVYGIVPDDAGHVFVFADVAGAPRGTVVDVFRDSGEYLGRMTLPVPIPLQPSRSPIVHVTRDHMYVVVRDELDVPFVLRLKIVRG